MGLVVPAFSIFSAQRIWGLGVDYTGYLEIFYGNKTTEIAFRFLKIVNSIVQGDSKSLGFVYFFCAFIGLYLKGIFYRTYSNSFFISVIFYIFTIYFLHEYTQIRAAIGLGICYLSIDEINKRQLKKFVIRIFVAMCFHYSAVIMFPIYLYCNFFKKQKCYIKILWGTFFIGVLLNKLLHGQTILAYWSSIFYSNFFLLEKLGSLQLTNEFSILNVCYFIIIILNTIYYLLYNGFPKKNIDFTIFQMSSVSALIFYLFFNFGFYVLTFRCSEFFIPFLFIVIAKIIVKFKERVFLVPFVCIILVYYMRIFIRAVIL